MKSKTGRKRTEPTHNSTLAVIMAGGKGSRLGDLTRWQSKPALPFAAHYRNIDFTLSNCVNSGIRHIALLTQYKAHSLIQHTHRGWNFFDTQAGEFCEVWPAQQRAGDSWYLGTADAVYQNIDLIEADPSRYVLVLAGDHIYQMDYRDMIDQHARTGARVTVGCVEVPVEDACQLGNMSVDGQGQIVDFVEKPEVPICLPDRPYTALASMGIYVFEKSELIKWLRVDAENPRSQHDFGRDLLPLIIRRHHAQAHRFRDIYTRGAGYWCDVGTLENYWQANMDLLGEYPSIQLDDPAWPIRTHQQPCPPTRYDSNCSISRSIVASGCSLGGTIVSSVISTGVNVGDGTLIENSVVLPGASIGRNAIIRSAVIDAGCQIEDDVVIAPGVPHLDDYCVSENGITLITTDKLTFQPKGEQDRRSAA